MLKSLTHCCQQPFFAIAEIKILWFHTLFFNVFQDMKMPLEQEQS